MVVRFFIFLGIIAATAALSSSSSSEATDAAVLFEPSSSFPSSSQVINLLPNGPLELYPYSKFDDNQESCSATHVLRSTYEEFALPANPQQFVIGFQGILRCEESDLAGVRRRGTLFTVGILEVTFNCADDSGLIISGGSIGSISTPVKLVSGLNNITLTLFFNKSDAQQPLKVCINGAPAAATAATASTRFPQSMQQYLTSSGPVLLKNGVSVGPRSPSQQSAIRAFFEKFVLINGRAPAAVLSLQGCPAVEEFNQPESDLNLPEITIFEAFQLRSGQPLEGGGNAVEVEEEVTVKAQCSSSSTSEISLSLTVYGLPPEKCDTSTCGDASFSSSSGGEVSATIKFPVSGRFIVRARAANGSGAVVWRDLALIVYKKGDLLQRRAPCCRHSAYITAHNLGRPIDRTTFRAETSAHAAKDRLDWSSAYWEGPDLEAERLFDYGVLAPVEKRWPVSALTCADVRVAGAGSPEVYGLLSAGEEVSGHGKLLTIVPEAFPWATGISDVECQQHWTGWNEKESEAGQYLRTIPESATRNKTCSVGCTAAGIRTLIESTSMLDQYQQALIQLSFGALSVAPKIRILPEIQVAKTPMTENDPNIFNYYDAPARAAVAAAPGPRPWMSLTLAPLALHKIPNHRAWSAGMASAGATVTKCFASMYYIVHETGHRLGFKHGQLWKLQNGHAAPAGPAATVVGEDSTATLRSGGIDPLGQGQFVPDEGYLQRLDIMSCCKSDFGLFHRTVTGWLFGSGRLILEKKDLAQQSVKNVVLWPFDITESRGKLVSVALRRSDNELLLIGFRSASHWQDFSANTSVEENRVNVRGLQVEYIRRDVTKGNGWNERGLLDFNELHGDWPDALPAGPGELARQTQFSLLKEGRAWFDSSSQVLLSFERIGACDGDSELPQYNYNVSDFYGFGGEWPGSEKFERQEDYSGHAAMQCAYMSLTTLASAPQGKLEITVSVVGNQNSLALEENGKNGLCAAASDNEVSAEASKLLKVHLQWDANSNVAAVVWKDKLNRTLDDGSFEKTTGADISIQSSSLPVSAHVRATDGRHSRAELKYAENEKAEYVLRSTLRYYEQTRISERESTVPGVLPQCSSSIGASTPKNKEKTFLSFILVIGGSMMGGLLLLVALVFSAVCILRKRRRQRGEADGTAERRRTTTPAALAAIMATNPDISSSTTSHKAKTLGKK